jgi:hypothetical protein
MKKLILLVVSILTLQQVNAQSFQAGSLVTSLDWGFDLYSVAQTYSLYNVPNSTSTKTSGAASTNWNLAGEFGVLNWLGLGVQLKLDNYVTSRDSTTGIKPTAIGFEGGIIANLHIIRHPHFNLLGGIDLGYSHLTYNTNDGFSDQVYGDGSWFDFHLTMRFYFGRFGLNFTGYSPVINYASLTSNNSNWSLGENVLASWKGKGGGINLGMQYRILN